ncbi:DUF4116 domain-containing protein [Endozoicomonas sp. ALC020]|uniref:DUF4116 domain-containing protein n=1 Tax=unclassified Endozoicomonas TaxID=2644528 RepID=UPI003BAF3DA5
MLNPQFGSPDYQSPTTQPSQNNGAKSPSKRYLKGTDPHDTLTETKPLAKRICRKPFPVSSDHSLPDRQQLGGKGMFLQRMQEAGLTVPPFRCVAASLTNALEQQPLDNRRLAPYLPEIVAELGAETSLVDIRKHLTGWLDSEPTRWVDWLTGLAKFVASHDFYEQVKDSETAQQIRDLRFELGGPSLSQPVIVRSSGINEDNYGDVQAGKYLSEIQGEDDVLRTCLKVMASGYRPGVCHGGIPEPMALIIQQCIVCQCGGVAMSFQSLQDNTIRVEYSSGQPRGAVAGKSVNMPHRINIERRGGADQVTYFPGTVSSHFILQRNSDNDGYSETEIHNIVGKPDSVGERLSDDLVSELRQAVAILEDLLLCPVDVEFGIDQQGRLFLLQVRPITRLSGGMDFAMAEPEVTLASGEGISEGYCTGPLWLAKKQKADSMPDGAIVVARHAEDWMLEPDCLKRIAGFVFVIGGFNDHVAILLRQKKIPLMLAGDQCLTLTGQDEQQATLVCARFDGMPRAFIVNGDLTGKLVSHRTQSSGFSDVPSVRTGKSADDLSPPEGTFREVASGFQWLVDQNARLLAFFAPGGGLDCLADPIKLSMSPERLKIMSETEDDVTLLLQGAEALLGGYRAFLLLAGEHLSPQLESLHDELPQLINRFGTLKETIGSALKRIILPLQAGEALKLCPDMFRQWMATCHHLQSSLQALHPLEAEQVQSVHDLIFALHQRFVKALAMVSLASGQGKVSTEQEVTYVDCTPPGDKTALLNQTCKAAIEKMRINATVVNMVDAVIVNLNFGNHVGIIELLEQAEGGKKRTLRLTFSDQFYSPDGSDQPFRLKRMWFLVQLLQAIELDKNADGMKLSSNAVAGEIIVECPRMKTTETMQDAFEKLIAVLDDALDEVEVHLRHNTTIFGGDQWNFNFLAQRLNSDSFAEADRFAFQHCLFSMFYFRFFHSAPDWCQLLSSHHKQFMDDSLRLAESKENPQEMLINEGIGEDNCKKFLFHLLLVGSRKATPLFEHFYSHLRNEYFVIKPPHTYNLEFIVSPGQSLQDHKEKVRNILLEYGLTYASQRVRSDKDFVLLTIKEHPGDLEYASPELRDNDEVVMTAIAKSPMALNDASERIRSDKHLIQRVIADDISFLSYASKEILNDRKYLLKLIKKHPRAFIYADDELKNDTVFVRSAIEKNSKVLEFI